MPSQYINTSIYQYINILNVVKPSKVKEGGLKSKQKLNKITIVVTEIYYELEIQGAMHPSF